MPVTKSRKRGKETGARTVKNSGTRKKTVTVMPLSQMFQPYAKNAEACARDPGRMQRLVDEAVAKANRVTKSKGALRLVWKEFQAMVRLAEAHADGRAEQVSWNAIVLSTGALLYFVSPQDLVPDWTPRVGLADDAAVIGMVAATIQDDLRPFVRPSSQAAGL